VVKIEEDPDIPAAPDPSLQAPQNDPTLAYPSKAILGHQGPLLSSHKDYNGSPYNLLIEWENGETTYEPLDQIMQDDPTACLVYAKKHKLFSQQWQITNKRNEIIEDIRPSKRSMTSKFGYYIPRNHDEDEDWHEIPIFDETQYGDNFQKSPRPPEGFSPTYNESDDDTSVESEYFEDVSPEDIRIFLILAAQNMVNLWGENIGTTYLNGNFGDRAFIIAMVKSFLMYGTKGSVTM
jgi:hypothetical protein